MDFPLRIAILDMYNGASNQGMRSIKEILARENFKHANQELEFEVFDTRGKGEIPPTSYDIYISTGGPGDPFDGEGKTWELDYFKLLDRLYSLNEQSDSGSKKFVFFICHSFQLMCRHFELGTVNKRKSTSFGIFPMHCTEEGKQDLVFQGLNDPYYGVDSRDYQVVEPNYANLKGLGAKILSLEKIREHVPYERAMMAIRISDEFFGTQFHPEADPIGMKVHFMTTERRKSVIEQHGEAKYLDMLEHLNDPDKIMLTNHTILPNFISQAVGQLRGESVWA